MARRTRGLGAAHEQRRTEIADAVLEIVAERGLGAVSLTEVAARAGVSAGRVQHYFPAKTGLVEAAFDRSNELASTRIAARTTGDAEHTAPRNVLTVVLTDLIPHDATTRVHLRVRQSFAALALSDDAIARRLRDEYAHLHRTLADLLRRDQRAGHIPPGLDPADATVRLVALAEGLAYYVLTDITPADRARALVLAAIDGLYPDPTRPSG